MIGEKLGGTPSVSRSSSLVIRSEWRDAHELERELAMDVGVDTDGDVVDVMDDAIPWRRAPCPKVCWDASSGLTLPRRDWYGPLSRSEWCVDERVSGWFSFSPEDLAGPGYLWEEAEKDGRP